MVHSVHPLSDASITHAPGALLGNGPSSVCGKGRGSPCSDTTWMSSTVCSDFGPNDGSGLPVVPGGCKAVPACVLDARQCLHVCWMQGSTCMCVSTAGVTIPPAAVPHHYTITKLH